MCRSQKRQVRYFCHNARFLIWQIFETRQIEQSNEIAAAAQIEFTFAEFDKFEKG